MLSNSPAGSSLHLEQRSPSRPALAGAFQPQAAIPYEGLVSPRQQLGSGAPAPGSPSQRSHEQQLPHGLNTPRPPLSPLSEYHSGFTGEDVGSAWPSPSPFSIANHQRQHSFPNLLPLAFRSRTPSPTRKTHARSGSEQMPYTGDGRSSGRGAAESPRGGGGGLGSWLSGSPAAAKALGLSHASADDSATTPASTPTRRPNPAGPGSSTASEFTTPKSTMTTASRFMSALSSRFNPTTPTNPSHTTTDDEFSTLNIETALFPPSPSSPSPCLPSSFPRDAFSPSAFKNLHMNAVGLLTRMQAAYRDQASALRELRAERSAQSDELDEAVTRASHLKMQLEGMARRAQEQEAVVRGLVEELAAERRARTRAEAKAEAEVARSRPLGEGASMVSEDLGVDEERVRVEVRGGGSRNGSGQRGSGGGVDDDETDFDEEGSAESESVFSRCRSPALPSAHAATAGSSDGGSSSVAGLRMDGDGTPNMRVTFAGNGSAANAILKRRSGQQMSAFQKILKGISGESVEDAGCPNCKGQDASVAWDTVGLLRDENRHLKRRVGELEVAVEGALDLVNGIGM
ncbi:hypothetical protein N658DRAFT_203531 [Parathielavia hyrcaniae]|uniref:Uncharacterized protein n=1 Tax=Parathielavia hyrcaniae TaxID=113614 RepID=A0AAN6PXQ4_9PEZI|nr:hypothetical protein N658DRAFT_203531 [Parathielavia hyrcaniae]